MARNEQIKTADNKGQIDMITKATITETSGSEIMKTITINNRDFNVRRIGFRKNMMAIFTASGRGKGRSNHEVYRRNENTGCEIFTSDWGLTIDQCRALIRPTII